MKHIGQMRTRLFPAWEPPHRNAGFIRQFHPGPARPDESGVPSLPHEFMGSRRGQTIVKERPEPERPLASSLLKNLVAADVRRLIHFRAKKSEPPYVGCYSSGAQGAFKVRSGLSSEGAGLAAAFTLIELLTVIGIIAVLAALLAPTVSQFRKGDTTATATRQMLDGVAYARQLAISQRTTVYMVFVPPNFWTDPAYVNNPALTPPNGLPDRIAATNLAGRQFIAYNFVTMRSVGDQPGQCFPRYLSRWRTLPESTFIADWKFTILRDLNEAFEVGTDPETGQPFKLLGFEVTTNIPFPLETTVRYDTAPPRPYPALPYVAFNYLGQLTSEQLSPSPSRQDEFIPLAHGSVAYANDPETKALQLSPASAVESPLGNSTNSYNLIHIDALTGRARLEKREIQ